MFSVLFEVHPRSDQWNAYLHYAAMLRAELERIDADFRVASERVGAGEA